MTELKSEAKEVSNGNLWFDIVVEIRAKDKLWKC